MTKEIIVDDIEVRDWRSALRNKEREYEELRQYHNKCCEENANELKDWLEKYSRLSRDFYSGKYCNTKYCKQLKRAEQKLEKIKNRCIEYMEVFKIQGIDPKGGGYDHILQIIEGEENV